MTSAEVRKATAKGRDEFDEEEWEYVEEPFGGRSRLIVGVLAVALALTIGTNVYLWLGMGDLQAREDARAAAGRASVRFATAYLNYDHRKIKDWRAGIERVSTPNYIKHNSGDLPGQEKLIKKLKVTGKGTVREVFVKDVTDGTARVILKVDQEVRSSKREESVIGSFMLLNLVYVDGVWKVDGRSSAGPGEKTAVRPGR